MRWVIKTGSSILAKPDGGLDRRAVRRISDQLIDLHKRGHEVILVSSGAVAAGVGRLKWKEKPTDLHLKQSAAAVGQLALLEAYEEFFSKAKIVPAQILLTRDDLLDRKRYLNIRHTLMNLLSLRTLPIINENDSVATEEIQFGDNDTLSAIVATKVQADRLVLLSDVDGLYAFGSEHKKSKTVIPVVERVTKDMEKKASRSTGSKHSVGGILAKLRAAKKATAASVETWIASGHKTDVLKAIEAGQPNAGTLFLPR